MRRREAATSETLQPASQPKAAKLKRRYNVEQKLLYFNSTGSFLVNESWTKSRALVVFGKAIVNPGWGDELYSLEEGNGFYIPPRNAVFVNSINDTEVRIVHLENIEIKDNSGHIEEIYETKSTGGARLSDRLARYDAMPFDDLNDEQFIEYALKRATDRPAFASALASSLNFTFNLIAIPSASLLSSEPTHTKPNMPLWRNREPGMNAVQFIQSHYGETRDGKWHHAGLRQSDLRSDPELYAAYATWKRRHPYDAIEFAPPERKPGGKRIDDAQDAIEQRRSREREAQARYRGRERLRRNPAP